MGRDSELSLLMNFCIERIKTAVAKLVGVLHVTWLYDLLQADVETLRDELEFKNHKIEEFESMLQAERQRLKEMGQELQVQKQ